MECFRIQVVPRIVQSALNIPALGCGEEMFRAFFVSYFVTIHSRFRMDNTRVVLARKHVLSILNQDCEA